MESLIEDPDLATEMVVLMGRELKNVRNKVEELERELKAERERVAVLEASSTSERKRAEATKSKRVTVKSDADTDTETSSSQNIQSNRGWNIDEKEIKKEEEEIAFENPTDERPDGPDNPNFVILENKMAEIQSKYDAQLIENEILRRTCELSESRIRELEAEKAKLSQKLKKFRSPGKLTILEMEGQVKQMEVQMTSLPQEPRQKTEPNVKMSIERPDFQAYLSKFRIPKSHPQFHRLYAVQSSRTNLNEYLPPILSASKCSNNFMHFPKRLTWSKSMNCALVFSPTNTIGAELGLWERSVELTSMHGHVGELFYSNDTSVYYAGTFECIHTSEWFPEGVNLPVNVLPESIADVALAKNSCLSAPYRAMISKSFADGVMKSECMILECIGFSRYLYNALLENYSESPNLKRHNEQDDGSNNKKVRWNLG